VSRIHAGRHVVVVSYDRADGYIVGWHFTSGNLKVCFNAAPGHRYEVRSEVLTYVREGWRPVVFDVSDQAAVGTSCELRIERPDRTRTAESAPGRSPPPDEAATPGEAPGSAPSAPAVPQRTDEE